MAFGSKILHGQVCFGTERVYVHSSVAEKFKMILLEAFKHFPSAGDTVSEASFKKAKVTLYDAVAYGAGTVPNLW